jgi:hypothetical protein
MELTLVGLQHSGKTTIVNVLVFIRIFNFKGKWNVSRRYDTYCWLQHEKGYKGKCRDEALGSWRPTSIQINVGEILQRCQCHRIRSGRGKSSGMNSNANCLAYPWSKDRACAATRKGSAS